jgi:hypothetical protein
MKGAGVRFMLMAVARWWRDRQPEAVAYLIEENRILRAQLRGRRLRLTDEDRCRLARRRCPPLLARFYRRGYFGLGIGSVLLGDHTFRVALPPHQE